MPRAYTTQQLQERYEKLPDALKDAMRGARGVENQKAAAENRGLEAQTMRAGLAILSYHQRGKRQRNHEQCAHDIKIGHVVLLEPSTSGPIKVLGARHEVFVGTRITRTDARQAARGIDLCCHRAFQK